MLQTMQVVSALSLSADRIFLKATVASKHQTVNKGNISYRQKIRPPTKDHVRNLVLRSGHMLIPSPNAQQPTEVMVVR